MVRIALPHLIDADRLPSTALRVTETDYKQRLFRLEDASVRALLTLYRDAFRDLREAAYNASDVLGVTTLDQSPTARRFRDHWLAYAVERIQKLTDASAANGLRFATTGFTGGYYARLWQLDVSTKPDVRINMPTLDMTRVIGNLADLREDVYDQLIQDLLGREWRQQYATELDDLTLRIRRALGEGMVDGDGIDGMMRRVRDAMGIDTDRRHTGRTVRANFNRVQSLTRTVVNRASNAGSLSAYRANTDILSGYEWLTAKDERVCPACAGMDGATFRFSSRLQPPLHPNCRCTVIPVIKADALETATTPPRAMLMKWAQGFGIERELADFLVPSAA